MGAQGPCEGVAELIAVEKGGLWQVEVCPVCQIGEDEFVSQAELGFVVGASWGNGGMSL